MTSKPGRRTCPAKRSTVASANLAGLGAQAVGRVRLAQGSWWSALPVELEGLVALAVANPPYVAEGEELPEEVSRSGAAPSPHRWARRGSRRSRRSWARRRYGWLRARSSSPRSRPISRLPPKAWRARPVSSTYVVRDDLAGRERVLVAKSFA